MKRTLVLVGLLVTTAVAAQMQTAPRNATLAQPGQPQVSPTAHLDDETAVDPQFELLRHEISELKRDRDEQGREIAEMKRVQGEEIAHLKHCVAELVTASKTFQTKGGATLAGTLQVADDDDGNGLADTLSSVKPREKPADLSGCG